MLMTDDRYDIDHDYEPRDLSDEELAAILDDAPEVAPLPEEARPFRHVRDAQEGYRPRVLDPSVRAAFEGDTFDLLSPSDMVSMPDPEWLIDSVLPADTFAVLFGAPGSTKSFWALDAACSVATGHSLHGSTVKPGKVIYAAGEGHRGLKWRLEAWKLAHPDADMEALERNLRILPRAVRLLEEADAMKILNTAVACAADGGLALLIVDTWARALTGGDENSSRDTGLAIDVCETVRAQTGATILVVHHSNKDGSAERGSTALKGAADAQMRMEKDSQTGVIALHCIKMKDSEEFETRRFILSQYGHSAVLLPSELPFNVPTNNGGLFNGGRYGDDRRYGREPF